MSQKYPQTDRLLAKLTLPQQLRLIENRDPKVLAALFNEINPVLFGMAKAQRISEESAEDLIHQTWQRFFENSSEFKGQSHIATFICGILVNKIRENRRVLKKESQQDEITQFENTSFSSRGWWLKEPQDPLVLFQNKNLGIDIEDCFEGLTEQQKQLFVLREVEDMDTDELCNLFNLSVSNLRVILFRAKEKLRHCLEGKGSV